MDSTAMATIATEVTNIVLTSVPEITDEIESSIRTYGIFL